MPEILPPPIPGRVIDPPLKSPDESLAAVESRSAVAGVGFRTLLRFNGAVATLLAAGTTYYVFLGVFALIALAFGLTAFLGADQLAGTVTDALEQAFPGLIGSEGLDPAQLRSIGQNTSVIGLLIFLYSGSGAMMAASRSLHLLYGAPRDGRNFVLARARLIAWMLLLAPMMLLSFAPSILVTTFAQPVLEFLGLADSEAAQWGLFALTLAVALVLDFLIIYAMLSTFGGIRPERRPRVIAALVGTVATEVLKYLMASIVAWSVAKPQYGAFAGPIAMLLVLYLLVVTLYATAALCAGIAEGDVG